MFECKYCGKTCKNNNSQKQHEVRCACNPNRRAHDHLSKYIHDTRLGQNKYTNEDIRKQAEQLKCMYRSGEIVPARKGKPGTFLHKHHSEETRKKIGQGVATTRKQHYRDGSISPAKGVGRGKYSYIIYGDKKYMCRSTYEFIYALYLLKNNIDFEMESIRVPAIRSNPYASTFLSDFSYDNVVVEVKGIKSGKDYYLKESFTAAGYQFIELFEEDILQCKAWLTKNGIDIDDIIAKIIDGHNSKQYFVYTYEK